MAELDQAPAAEELPPDAADAGAEADLPEEVDPAALAAELEDLRAENQRLDKRYKDTFTWGNEAHQDRLRLQGALSQATTQPQAPPQAPAAPQPFRPPQLSEQEKEMFATDPDFAFKKMWELAAGAANFAEQRTRQTLEPVIAQLVQQAQATSAMLPAAVEPAANAAAYTAADKAERLLGIPRDHFNAAFEAGTRMLWDASQGNEVQFNQLRTNPDAVLHAVVEARMRSGGSLVPTQRPAIPPTVGTSPRTAPPAPRRAEIPESARRIQEGFGVKLTPEQIKFINTGAT